MAQLTKGMYGHEFNQRSDLFGLRCMQMRSDGKITHNSGWYNRSGEKLGWGDLSTDDFLRISNEIAEDELFIILGEQDSFLNFVEFPGAIGGMSIIRPEEKTPGVYFIAEKCRYIIARGKLYYISRYGDVEDITRGGLRFKTLTRDEAKQLIDS